VTACILRKTIKINIKINIKTIKSSSTQGSQFNEKEHELPCMHCIASSGVPYHHVNDVSFGHEMRIL